jgi:DNA-binding MarR family transcriptional regulator
VRREVSVGFHDLLVQMKITNKLLAAQLKFQMKQNELIALLGTTGATTKEIAEIVNTTPATVTTALVRLKKQSRQSNANSTDQPST